MADAESSRILKQQTCILTEATRELATINTPVCGSCPLPISIPSFPPYQDCSSLIIGGDGPTSIVISPDSLTAWVITSDEGDEQLYRIDQTTDTSAGTIYMGYLRRIAVDSTNTYIWGTNSAGVIRIEIATYDISGPLAVGNNPQGIAISPDNLTVWVANYQDNTVSYINAATFQVYGVPIPVGSRPLDLVVTPTTVYVINSNGNTVSCISTSSYTVTNTFTVGNNPQRIAISPDNSILWVANTNSNTISVIDSTIGFPIQTINISHPVALAISPDYSSVWVTQGFLNTVTRIDALTYAAISTISIGNFPLGIAINPDNSAVLIANTTSNTVTKLYIPSPPPSFLVEGLPIPDGGAATLLITVIHGRSVDLTTYVQASDGSLLTFILPFNIGGSVALSGSILTAYQTITTLPITVRSPSNCFQTPGSMILNIILTVPAFVTPSESNYILSKVAACPLYTLNKIPPNPCRFVVAPDQGTLTLPPDPIPGQPYPYVTTPPGALHQYRTIPRIRGIDQITTLVRGQSASEATTRRQQAVLRGNVESASPFFRKPLPPPPCSLPFIPKPPYPPAPPCRPVKF